MDRQRHRRLGRTRPFPPPGPPITSPSERPRRRAHGRARPRAPCVRAKPPFGRCTDFRGTTNLGIRYPVIIDQDRNASGRPTGTPGRSRVAASAGRGSLAPAARSYLRLKLRARLTLWLRPRCGAAAGPSSAGCRAAKQASRCRSAPAQVRWLLAPTEASRQGANLTRSRDTPAERGDYRSSLHPRGFAGASGDHCRDSRHLPWTGVPPHR